MVHFMLTGRIEGRSDPVLITDLKELAALIWDSFGGKDGIQADQKISIGFGVILSMLLSNEAGMALTLGTMLRYLAFEEARIIIEGVEWMGGVDFPIVIDYRNLQDPFVGPLRVVYKGEKAKEVLGIEDGKGESKEHKDDAH